MWNWMYPDQNQQENFYGKIITPANPIFPVDIRLSCQDQNVNMCDVVGNPNISEQCKNYAYVLTLLRDEYLIDPNAIQMIWEDKFKDMCESDFSTICKAARSHTWPVFQHPEKKPKMILTTPKLNAGP